MAGPLNGIRVVDLTHVLNGPFCTLLLAHMGAEVIKIEHGAGDRYRHSWLPPNVDRDSYNFMAINSNKKGVLLDLKSEKGKDLFRQLIAKSDIVVENFTTGVMDRLGLGYEALRKLNPRLIYACSTGYGETGPYSHVRANAGTIQAITGWSDAQMRQAQKPGILGPGHGDEIAGVSMCVGILGALYNREKGGGGQKIEVSMQEAHLGFMVPLLHTHFEGREISSPPKQCADGYFFFHVPDMTDKLWTSLTQLLGWPQLAKDPRFATERDRRRNYAQVEEAIGDMAKDKTRQKIWEVMISCGFSSAPVLSVAECIEDPHLKERGAFVELEHPVAGKVKLLAPWIRFSETQTALTSPAPLLGQHNDDVFGNLLGLSTDQIKALQNDGVIGVAPAKH
jgi:crotonobetainyl-CoA:carnitine CoA-transferase CaiB-like acyl-CoA transferase